MKIVFKLVITLLFLSYTGLCVADVGNEQNKENPLLLENKDLAEFGMLAASTSLSYAKSVRRVYGATIIDVVVVDKLCHVTVDESTGKLLAKSIECDSGRYFNNGSSD